MNQIVIPSSTGRSRRSPAELYIAQLPSQNSQETMVRVFERICDVLQIDNMSAIPWEQMSNDIALAVRASFLKGKSPAFANLVMTAIRGGATEAWKEGIISGDHLQRLKSSKSIKFQRLKRPLIVTEGVAREMIAHAEGCPGYTGIRDAAMIAMLFGTGCRRAELAGMTMRDLSLQARSVRVIGKGNKERQIEIPSRAMAKLREWLSARDRAGISSLFIFNPAYRLKIDPRGISKESVSARVKHLGNAIGIEGLQAHDMRRGFITYMLDAGFSPATVAAMVGHDSVDTTKGYDQEEQRRCRAAADAINL